MSVEQMIKDHRAGKYINSKKMCEILKTVAKSKGNGHA